jgi:NTE family protein
MADIDEPSTRIPATVTRATSGIYGDRVREEQLSDIRRQPGRSALIHLRKGLPALVVPPVPDDSPDTATTAVLRGAVSYDVAPQVQLMLSQVRTDLDSFSEVEAHSLAGYGYAMSAVELEVPGIKELAADDSTVGSWEFTRVLDYLRRPPDRFLRQLAIAQKRFGKPFALSARAKVEAILAAILALAVVAGLLALVVYLLRGWLTSDIPAWGAVVAVPAFAIVVAAFVVLYLKRAFRSRSLGALSEYLYGRLSPALLALPLWLFARFTLHQHTQFLKAGRIDAIDAEVAKDSSRSD